MEEKSIYIHQELVNSCKNGDQKAFKELYGLYAKSMFNVALRILKNKTEAEDTMQEAFIKAYYRINQYDFQATFGAWLKRIVVNQALDFLRKESKWQIGEMADNISTEENDSGWEDIELKVDTVKQAVLNLPTGFRTVASLYLFEGYEHKEIAEILSISENTSKSQFHRAKKKIRDFIKEYETGKEHIREIH